MKYACLLLLATVGLLLGANVASAASPDETIASAKLCLNEALANPAKSIPAKMLSEAYAVAIIPDVIKIGFIGGVRRGHGVVLVRDKDGEWGLPQFITLTGGSIGWQAGAQSSDIVLVFRSERSVQNLLKGKFTLGADAGVAAGPVGRRVEAATDLQLKAEILSYARSRGLFAGVSLDGSAIEIDGFAHQTFYGSAMNELPRQIPQSATQLLEYVASVTNKAATDNKTPAADAMPSEVASIEPILVKAYTSLTPLLDDKWQRYLALPAAVFDPKSVPDSTLLDAVLGHYETVARTPAYAKLSQRQEFQATLELLREYTAAVKAAQNGAIALPPPPPPSIPAAGTTLPRY